MKDIQVGDVWANNDVEFNIVMAFSGRVAYWFIDGNGKLGGNDSLGEIFIKNSTLVKRDGKKFREFEEGAYYAVQIINANIPYAVLQYSKGKFWPNQYFVMSIDDHDIVSADESELSWIGEKLEITWPEV